MENKYFTPDIEDLYVGYKLEIKGSHDVDWQPVVLGKDAIWQQFTNLENLGQAMEQLRVPYLTKELIEAEGWKHDDRYNDVKHFYINEIQLTLYIGYLKEEIIYHHISIFHGGGIMFRGECKDINTFRKIIKLLKI